MIDCGVYNIKQLIIKQLIGAFNTIHQAARDDEEARYPSIIEIHDNEIYRSIIMHVGADIIIDGNIIYGRSSDPIHIE